MSYKCRIVVFFLAWFRLSVEGCFSARSQRENFIQVNSSQFKIALIYYLSIAVVYSLNEEIKKDARMA